MSYVPNDQARLFFPWNITFLSQRDVSTQVPVNYISPVPGISITAACFANNVYRANITAQCLSNLLATGFRRLIFDLYWDARALKWSFCPVELPNPVASVGSSVSSPAPTTSRSDVPEGISGTPVFVASNSSADRAPPTLTSEISGINVAPRQALSPTGIPAPSTISGASAFLTTFALDQTATSTATVYSVPPSASGGDELLYPVGPYACSPSLDLPFLIGLLNDFLKQTDNTLQAVLTYIVINVHAAKSLEDPAGPAPRPDASRLPSASDSIGVSLNANLSSYLFTPKILFNERSNLNSSWFTVANSSQPDPSYYATEFAKDGIATSPNGWPSESFMVFENTWRLLIGIDAMDSQLAGYGSESDRDLVFSEDFLSNYVSGRENSVNAGHSACPFDPNNRSLAAANSSWAVGTDPLDQGRLATNSSEDLSNRYRIRNLTACGISPILNNTLGDITADQDIQPYQGFIRDSVWAWAYNEPKEDSQAPPESAEPSSSFRCAILNGTTGRWSVTFCQDKYWGACRTPGMPYSWQLSTEQDTYGDVGKHCPSNASFAVPRTALENRYLIQSLQDSNTPVAWIDFNSLDAEYCWVSGFNSTCPYEAQPSHGDNAIILPTVAAIIIIILALLTLLIKCGSNRIKSKKRRRMLNGWDYEGVPS